MQFLSSRQTPNKLGGSSSRSFSKPSASKSLSLYMNPPTDEITLDEFEDFALERLTLLRGIEQLRARGFEQDELRKKVLELEKKHVPIRMKDATKIDEDKRKDELSHFILRLAYCRTEDLRRWFLDHECFLLKLRLDQLKDSERADFMIENKMSYDEVTPQEKNERRDKLVGLCDVTEMNFASKTTIFYKVPFTRALSLMRSRQVYIEAGMAYVPLSRLVSIIIATYRAQLSRALVEASNIFDYSVANDPRIAPLLKNMNKQYVGKDFSKSEGSIGKLTADMVDKAAESSMPLCMKNLHNALKKDHKIKHSGRLQYGLFLKGAGMEMQDAMQFWEMHFGKVMTHDSFVKQYSYNIQHLYGKVGARKNYTPYSCQKIIMGEQGNFSQTFHGCPYKSVGEGALAGLLKGLKLGSDEVNSIVKFKSEGHYQLACMKHFDISHPGHGAMDIGDGAYANHPNSWYQASIKYHRTKNGLPIDGSDPDKKEEGKEEGVNSAAGFTTSDASQSQTQSPSQVEM